MGKGLVHVGRWDTYDAEKLTERNMDKVPVTEANENWCIKQ
jgi:hypothetical protein